MNGEELSCLAIVRLPNELSNEDAGSQTPGSRRSELCQLPDLLFTFLDSLELDIGNLSDSSWGQSMLRLGPFSAPFGWPAQMQSAYVEHLADQWIRTPAWSALFRENKSPELFVKPDDRWEISDISSRRLDIVERLREISYQFQECLRSGKRVQLPKLEDDLCNLLR